MEMEIDTSSNFDSKLPDPPANYGPPTVSLADFIERTVNRIKRDHVILTELLNKKSGVDRKISISCFVESTQQQFRKLLDIVKWVSAGNQLDQINRQSYYLDEQAKRYVETADSLVEIVRGQLFVAGMPFLHVPHAVEVLTSGSFSRLPTSIMSRYLGEPILTEMQTKLTLKWLSNLMEYRLIQESRHIPKAITMSRIKNGVTIFTAPHEFKAFMTLKAADGDLGKFENDAQLAKWRWEVLNIEILLTDFENDFDNDFVSSVLHPDRRRKLIAYCNSRLNHDLKDINTVYETIHGLIVKLHVDLFSSPRFRLPYYPLQGK